MTTLGKFQPHISKLRHQVEVPGPELLFVTEDAKTVTDYSQARIKTQHVLVCCLMRLMFVCKQAFRWCGSFPNLIHHPVVKICTL